MNKSREGLKEDLSFSYSSIFSIISFSFRITQLYIIILIEDDSEENQVINYILLYKIRKKVKKILKEKIDEEELLTTKKSCVGCVADDISWEVYYLLKESKS